MAFLRRNADLLLTAKLPERPGLSGWSGAAGGDSRYIAMERLPKWQSTSPGLEDLDARLTLRGGEPFAVLLAAMLDDEIVAVRTQALYREISPDRRKMSAAEIDQLQKQYLHKRLLEKYGLPRLSLFYM